MQPYSVDITMVIGSTGGHERQIWPVCRRHRDGQVPAIRVTACCAVLAGDMAGPDIMAILFAAGEMVGRICQGLLIGRLGKNDSVWHDVLHGLSVPMSFRTS